MRFFFLIIFSLFICSNSFSQIMLNRSGAPMLSPFFKTGEKIKPFVVTDIDGKIYNSQELEGKVIVLNFWFIACAPCVKEIPELNQIVDKYKKRSDIIFLALAPDKKVEIVDFISKTPFNYQLIPDTKELVQSVYKVGMFPTHLVLNKAGEVAFHTSGYNPSTVNSIESTIKDLLKL